MKDLINQVPVFTTRWQDEPIRFFFKLFSERFDKSGTSFYHQVAGWAHKIFFLNCLVKDWIPTGGSMGPENVFELYLMKNRITPSCQFLLSGGSMGPENVFELYLVKNRMNQLLVFNNSWQHWSLIFFKLLFSKK